MDQDEGDGDDEEEDGDQPQNPPDDVQAEAGRSAPWNFEGDEGAPRWGALCYCQTGSLVLRDRDPGIEQVANVFEV